MNKNIDDDKFISLFASCMNFPDMGPGTMTMGLYWLRPEIFMPLDSRSRAMISETLSFRVPEGNVRWGKGDRYAEQYCALLEMIHDLAGHTIPELFYQSQKSAD
jgi:5-methylcytosine-specific restriction protein B